MYREDFLISNNKYSFRCAYCGKKLDRKTLVVDHIFPVAKMMDSAATRSKARWFGIYETNCLRNLAPSCNTCNQKKSAKMGLWTLRGLLGRYEWFWNGVKVAEISLVIIGLIVMVAVFNIDSLMDWAKEFASTNVFK